MDSLERARDLIRRIYAVNPAGGNCHIVLDDENIEDSHIRWVLDVAIPENYHEQSEEMLAIERECMELFLALSMTQRRKAMLTWYRPNIDDLA